MNEVRALVKAFDEVTASGKRCALATIVSVEGSSYRRPGARMLISERGDCTGTISAGCLEGDVVEHAMRVIQKQKAKLVEYDTASTSDEIAWGLGLGCNGTVRVLVEPLAQGSRHIEALRRASSAGADTVRISVATVYQGPSSFTNAVGRILIDENSEVTAENLNDNAAAVLESELRSWQQRGVTSGVGAFEANGAEIKVFIETLLPPVPLVIFGAGQDAVPIVELAGQLGWQTQVFDPQSRPASLSRFAAADRVTLSRPEDVAEQVQITPRTFTLLMTHNYAHDVELLKFLLASPARYLGVMGPRKRTERMLLELGDDFQSDQADLARLHSPVGLDIGANSPSEIGVSVIAEMRAVLAGRDGGMLRDSRGSIHSRPVDGESVAITVEHEMRGAAA